MAQHHNGLGGMAQPSQWLGGVAQPSQWTRGRGTTITMERGCGTSQSVTLNQITQKCKHYKKMVLTLSLQLENHFILNQSNLATLHPPPSPSPMP